jgi:hypothetical protein
MPRKKPSDAGEVLDVVAPVFTTPDDNELRRVVGDALLERGHPWGDVIATQLCVAEGRAKVGEKKRAAELALEHVATLAGAIAGVAHHASYVFERGFLAEVAIDRRGRSRTEWEAAARAPHWATVRATHFSVLTVPQWWVGAWVANPAAMRSLLVIDVSNALVLDRPDTASAWTVRRATPRPVYIGMLAALAVPFTFARKVPANHRAAYEG